MPDNEVQSQSFLDCVRPALAERDAEQLADAVRESYDVATLRQLLAEGTLDARRVASLTLGLVGDNDAVPALAEALHDEDKVVAELAEQALWSIWFRAGQPEAIPAFREGVEAMDSDSFEQAIDHFTESIERDPDFVEAYNQRALAHYLQEDWQAALADCSHVVQRMPEHFAAWAGAGHSYAHIGELRRAAAAYRQAVEIHPRMHAIRGALERIEHRLGD